MPTYRRNGKTYNIPDNEVDNFEKTYPDATQKYDANGKSYNIPVSKRRDFLSFYKDAKLYGDPSSVKASDPEARAVTAPASAQTMDSVDDYKPEIPDNLSKPIDLVQQMSEPTDTQKREMERRKIEEQARQAKRIADARHLNASADKVQADYDAIMGNPFSTMLDPMMGSGIRSVTDAQVQAEKRKDLSRASAEKADDTINMIEEAKKKGNTSYIGGLGRGFWEKASKASNWDFGGRDLQSNLAVAAVADKFSKGQPLSAEEDALLDAVAIDAAAQGEFSGDLGRGYKAGSTMAESLPFMAEFMINPATGAGSAIGKAAAKQLIVKFGKEAAKSTIGKIARVSARAAGDVAGAAAMAGTTGILRTSADAVDRATGEAKHTIDADGYYRFDGAEEGDGGIKAFAKAYGASTIENFSEMFGNYLAPIGSVVGGASSRAMNKVGIGKVNDLIGRVRSSDFAKIVNDFERKAQWNGTISEYLEEQAGMLMNALTVGDNSLSDLTDMDTQIDTFLGVSTFGGLMSGIKTAGYAKQKYAEKKRLNEAGRDVYLGEGHNWNALKSDIDNADDTELLAILSNVMNDQSIYDNQKQSVLLYAGRLKAYHGASLADLKRKTDGDTPREIVQSQMNFDEGYRLAEADVAEKRKITRELDAVHGKLDREFLDSGEEERFEIIRQRGEAGEDITNELAYVDALSRFYGMIQGIRDVIDEKVAASNQRIERVTHADGNIYDVTLATDGKKHVYPISGTMVIGENGIIDRKQSDNRFITRDETGKIEMRSVEDLYKVESSENGSAMKEITAQTIREQESARYAEEIETPSEEEKVEEIESLQAGSEVFLNVGGVPMSAVVQSIYSDGSIEIHFDEKITGKDGKKKNVEVFTAEEMAALIAPNEEVATEEVDDLKNGTDIQDEVKEITGDIEVDEEKMTIQGLEPDLVDVPELNDIAANEIDLSNQVPDTTIENASIPMDNKGNYIYHRAPVESTLENIRSYGLDDAETDEFVAAQKANAAKFYDKARKGKPKVGTNLSKYQSDKKAWEESVLEAKAQVDYWDEADAQIQATRMQPGDANAKAISSMGDPVNAEEFAAAMLGTRKLPLLFDDYKSETGFSNQDAKGMFGIFSSKSNGGMSIEQAGEKLMEMDSANGTNFFDQSDANAGRNTILDVLSSSRTRGGLFGYIKDSREKMAERERKAEYDAYEKWVNQAKQMSVEEYESDEETFVSRTKEFVDSYNFDEINGDIADDLINEENDRRTEESGVESISRGTADNIQGEFDKGTEVGGIEQSEGSGIIEESEVGRQGGAIESVLPGVDVVGSERIDDGSGSEDLILYHGSPYSFDVFDADEIGTGEGGGKGMRGVNLSEVDGMERSPFFANLRGDDAPIHLGVHRPNEKKVSPTVYTVKGNGLKLFNAHKAKGLNQEELIASGYDGTRTKSPKQITIFPESIHKIQIEKKSGITDFIQEHPEVERWADWTTDKTLYPEVFDKENAVPVREDGENLFDYAKRIDESRGVIGEESNDKTKEPASIPFESPAAKEGEGVIDYAERVVSSKTLHDEQSKVDTDPTDAQKEAGNYRMGHLKIGNHDVTIENPKGSVRRGVDANGKAWEIPMNNTYGYFRGTKGKDGDHIDTFLGDNLTPENVYVVDQVNEDGSFDEHKVMFGFDSIEEAKEAYLSNYEDGWKGLGGITSAPREVFDEWLKNGTKKRKPFAEYNAVKDQNTDPQVLFREKENIAPIFTEEYYADGSYNAPETTGNLFYLRFTDTPKLDIKHGSSRFYDSSLDEEEAISQGYQKDPSSGWFWEHSGLSGHHIEAESLDEAIRIAENEGPWFRDAKGDSWSIFENDESEYVNEDTPEGNTFKPLKVLYSRFVEGSSTRDDRENEIEGGIRFREKQISSDGRKIDTRRVAHTAIFNGFKRYLDGAGIKYVHELAKSGSKYISFDKDGVSYKVRFANHTKGYYGHSEDRSGIDLTIDDNGAISIVDIDIVENGFKTEELKLAVGDVERFNKNAKPIDEKAYIEESKYPSSDIDLSEYPIIGRALENEMDRNVSYHLNLKANEEIAQANKTDVMTFTASNGVVVDTKGSKNSSAWSYEYAHLGLTGKNNKSKRNSYIDEAKKELKANMESFKNEVNEPAVGVGATHVPTSSTRKDSGNSIDVPINPTYTMNNVASTLYRKSSGFSSFLNGRSTGGFGFAGGKINIPKAKAFYSDFKVEAKKHKNMLQEMKDVSSMAARRYLDEVIGEVDYALDYYKRLANNEDVWRTQQDPMFREKSLVGASQAVNGKSTRVEKESASEIASAAQLLSDSLSSGVRIIHDVNDIADDNSDMLKRKRNSKGWFDPATGEVVVVLPNATSIEDVQSTILHEVVAHKGLRDMLGRDFDSFLDKVYRDVDGSIREKIVNLSRKHGFNTRVATEEYLAGLAERGFENMTDKSVWNKVKEFFMEMLSKAGIKMSAPLSDSDLRYILWRSYENQMGKNDIISKAKDSAMRGALRFKEDYLKAPNGKRSNLTKDQHTQVRTDEFKKWFGDWENDLENSSKVVDENGEPKVTYHQTNSTIWVNKNTGEQWNKLELEEREKWKSKSQKEWDMAWEERDFNVFDNIGRGRQSIEMPAAFFAPRYDEYHEYGKRTISSFLNIKNPATNPEISNAGKTNTAGLDAMNELISNGYDGFINYEDGDVYEYGAFSPNQIKSATDNTGGFSPNNDDIRFREDSENSDAEDIAKQEYEASLDKTKSKAHRWQEAYQDSMLGLKKMQEAIEKESGDKLQHFENSYMAENQMSSKSAYETEVYKDKLFVPMLDAVKAIVKNGSTQGEVNSYVMAKHGLERNKEFAWRDALRSVEESKGKDFADNLRSEHDMIVSGLKKKLSAGEIDVDTYNNELFDTRAALAPAYISNRTKDYSGLSQLTKEKVNFEQVAKEMVGEFESSHYDLCDNLWEKVNAATKQTLKKSYESGMMIRSVYEKIRTMFDYYVPLRGWNDAIASDVYEYVLSERSTFQAPVKAAIGRKSQADNPFANIGNMAESGILQGNRNLMKQKFLNMVSNHPTSLATVKTMWYENVGTSEKPVWEQSLPDIKPDASADDIAQAIDDHEARMVELGKNGMATKSTKGIHLDYRASKREKSEHIVTVKSGGKDYVIFVNGNPRAAQAINGLTNPDATDHKFMQIIGKVNRQLAANFTTRNPAFVLSNMSRDVIFSTSAIWVKEDWRYAKRFDKNIIKNIGAIMGLMSRYKSGKLDMSNSRDRHFIEFLENGGETGYTALHNVDEYKKMMDRHIKKSDGAIGSLSSGARAIVDAVSFMNRCAENVSRFTTYQTSREVGRGISESVRDAKEVTVNFNKKGAGGLGAGTIKSLFLFFNAAVQSLNNFKELHGKSKNKFYTTVGGFAAAGILLPMLNNFIIESLVGDGDDDLTDEERAEWKRKRDAYDNLPDWVRKNNFCLWVGGEHFITIPIPIELRAFYGLGEMWYQMGRGNMNGVDGRLDVPKASMEMVNQLTDLLPINPFGGNGDALSVMVPDTGKPFYQVLTNKDFFGKPIYKKNDYNELMPAWTKAFSGTAKWMVNSAELLNEVSGGDKYMQGGVDLNPAAIEHVLEGYFGGMGKTANQLYKTVSMIWSEDERMWRNVPVANRFFTGSDNKISFRKVNEAYYKYLDEYKETEQRLRGYENEAEMDVEKYAEKYDFLNGSLKHERYLIMKEYKDGIDEMRKTIKESDPEEKKEVETEINLLMMEMIDELGNIK